jgi:hypothetical protein
MGLNAFALVFQFEGAFGEVRLNPQGLGALNHRS